MSRSIPYGTSYAKDAIIYSTKIDTFYSVIHYKSILVEFYQEWGLWLTNHTLVKITKTSCLKLIRKMLIFFLKQDFYQSLI